MTAVGIGHSAASHTRIGSSPDSGVSPNLANSAASLSSPALAVVRSLSPVKIEFAPARKHNACVASDMLSRPADRRTIERGDRKRDVEGKRGSVRVDLGGRRVVKKTQVK